MSNRRIISDSEALDRLSRVCVTSHSGADHAEALYAALDDTGRAYEIEECPECEGGPIEHKGSARRCEHCGHVWTAV